MSAKGTLRVDDIVRHQEYGIGIVLAVDGYDITVAFPRETRDVHSVKLSIEGIDPGPK